MYSQHTRIVVTIKKPDIVQKINRKSEELRISRNDIIKIAICEFLNGSDINE